MSKWELRVSQREIHRMHVVRPWSSCHSLLETFPDDFRSFYQNDFRFLL